MSGKTTLAAAYAERHRASEKGDELAAFQEIKLHPNLYEPWSDCRLSNWWGAVRE